MTVVVRVENVSKRYELGRTGTQTLKGDAQRWWASLRGKEDPFAKVNEESNGRNGEFWALKDVNFDIHQGDAIGIIGKNGAGKSTLLKILSRITLPTTGRIRVKGRIASLLEVGTGFNPDLSGRENIYLNGGILGMTKAEVRRKFDEIVDFSGVEKFIDTPVKRYSSGMYVRLAFAVAAHLDSEILILDEVLAVGDAEFQAKCLRKMDDVAHRQGRTVIFVSHSMASVRDLCNKALLLINGKVALNGSVDEAASMYLNKVEKSLVKGVYQRDNIDYEKDLLLEVELRDRNMNLCSAFSYGDTLNIVVKTNPNIKRQFGIHVRIRNSKNELLGFISSWIKDGGIFEPGEILLISVPFINLVQDSYCLDFICNLPFNSHIDNWWDFIKFNVISCKPDNFPFHVEQVHHLGGSVISEAKFTTVKEPVIKYQS